jgi:hypothetical protein
MGRAVIAQHDGKAGHSLRADETNFKAFVAIARDNRSKPPLDKIAVLDGLVGLFENLAYLQRDRLQVGLEQGKVGVG